MSNVISLAEHRPHVSGNAKCLQCGHEWHAVAPLGVNQLQCPSCELDKGVFCGTANRGGLHYQCSCGCMHMFLHVDGVYCANCGEWASD